MWTTKGIKGFEEKPDPGRPNTWLDTRIDVSNRGDRRHPEKTPSSIFANDALLRSDWRTGKFVGQLGELLLVGHRDARG